MIKFLAKAKSRLLYDGVRRTRSSTPESFIIVLDNVLEEGEERDGGVLVVYERSDEADDCIHASLHERLELVRAALEHVHPSRPVEGWWRTDGELMEG